MAEYIERQSVLAKKFNLESRLHEPITVVLASEIERLPAADVRPVVHGKWIDSDEPGVPSHCSCCGYPIDRFYKTKYCPDCGADMEVSYHGNG